MEQSTSSAGVPIITLGSSSEASSSGTISEVTVQEEHCMNEMAYAEEFLTKKSSIQMLPYQKQMFLDLIHSDGLLVCAK